MQPVSLEQIVLEARQFLEPLWVKAHASWADVPLPAPPSKHMCRYSCIFLKEVLEEAGMGTYEIKLGRPPTRELEGKKEGKFGYRAPDGGWYDHAWLANNDILIDITADQFASFPIIITKVGAHDYRTNISEKDAHKDIQKLSHRVIPWLQAWRTRCTFA